MDKQVALEEKYRSKRRLYEEQESELFIQRNKAVSILDEVQDRSHHYLKDVVSDNDMLTPGFRQVEQMKEDVFESTRMNLKELSTKLEALDEGYYSQLRKLNVNKK